MANPRDADHASYSREPLYRMIRDLLETPGLLQLPPQLDAHLVAFYHDLREQKYSHKDFRIHPDQDGAITKRLTESAPVLSLPPLPVALPPLVGPEPSEPRSQPVTAASEVGAGTSSSKDAAANSHPSRNGVHNTDSRSEVRERNLEADNSRKVAKGQDVEGRTSDTQSHSGEGPAAPVSSDQDTLPRSDRPSSEIVAGVQQTTQASSVSCVGRFQAFVTDPTDEPTCHNSNSESQYHSIRSESEVGAGTTTSEGGPVIEFRGGRSKKSGSHNHDDNHDNREENEATDVGQNFQVVEERNLETQDATKAHDVATQQEDQARSGDMRSRSDGGPAASMPSEALIIEDVEQTAQEGGSDTKCAYQLRSRDQDSNGKYAGQSAGNARSRTGRKRSRKGSGGAADGHPPAKKPKVTDNDWAKILQIANGFGTGPFDWWIERLEDRWNKSSQDAFLHEVTRSPLIGDLADISCGHFFTVMRWHYEKSEEDPEREGLLRIQQRRDYTECYCFFQAAIADVRDAKKYRPSLFFQWTDRILLERGETPTRRYGRGIKVETVVNDRLIDIFYPKANDPSPEERELLRETRKNAMEKRRKRGELWYELIVHLGLGVLCLAPTKVAEGRFLFENNDKRNAFVHALIARKSELGELLLHANAFIKKTLLKESGDHPACGSYPTPFASETDLPAETPGLTEHQEIDQDVEHLIGTSALQDVASVPNAFSPGASGGVDGQVPLVVHPATYFQADGQNADAFRSDPISAASANEPSYFNEQWLVPPAMPRSDCSYLG